MTSRYPAGDSIVIAAAVRTPMGGFQGELATATAPELGATAIRAAVERAGVASDQVEEVIMGQVVQAGCGQNPARQAALKAGLTSEVGALTINKVCGSGLKAVILAAQSIRAGDQRAVLAGGMESMTNAPHLMFARKGIKYGASAVYDHMAMDGLEDAYERGKAMGVFAES